jgi:hypothetical protein
MPLFGYLVDGNNAIGRIGDRVTLKRIVEHHVDAVLVLCVLFKDNVSFFEADEFCSFKGLRYFFNIKNFLNFAFLDNVGDDVPPDNIPEAVPQTRFDILATHRDNFDVSAGKQRVRPNSTFDQNRIFAEAVPGLKLMVLLLDSDSSLLDNVERVGIIALVEDDLSLFVSLCQTTTCQCILLILSQVLKEGKDLQKLAVFFVVLLVYVVHDLLEYFATD